LLAKEDIPCKLIVAGGYKEEFGQKFNNLRKHGETLEIDPQAIRLAGSNLLEFIASEIKFEKFIMSCNTKKAAVQKIWLKSLETQEVFHIDDIHGEVSVGEESFSFIGKAYGGLLELKYTCPLTSETASKLTFTINLVYKKWDSHPINALPYFGKIKQLFNCLATGCKLSTTLEIDGLEIFTASDPDFKDTEAFNNFHRYCDYISLASSVFNRFNKTILHNSNFKYSPQTHELLFMINKTLNGESVCSNDYTTTLTCTFIAEDDLENIKLITKTSDPRAIKLEQDFGGTLELFGETIQLPRSYILLSSVVPLIQQPIDSIRPGDEVIVEWISQDDCQFSSGFFCDT
jgi:hypothetical protein